MHSAYTPGTTAVVPAKASLYISLGLLSLLLAAGSLHAQDLGTIAKQKPFRLTGSLGAGANFYTSNEPYKTQPPFSWNLNGNFNAQVYGVAVPFSFLVNQYSTSYSNPFTQFGLSPTYKWARLHLGYRTITFSPLTFEGQSFRGAGLELTPGVLRLGGFYGKLNRAVNEDTTSGRYRMPQFSRKAYGIKAGVGNASNYFDLQFFHAKDDSLSATVVSKTGIQRPQENAVAGTSFKVTVAKKLSLSGDLAVSALTMDQAFSGSLDTASRLAKKIDKVISLNGSTVADWAAQAQLRYQAGSFFSVIGYRRVQPDYKSLGTTYMVQDLEMYSLSNGAVLSKGKVNLQANFSMQHNNLAQQLVSELVTKAGNLNVNTILTQKLSVNLNASGYKIDQEDGLIKVKDSARVRQAITQVNISPVYNILAGRHNYNISGNAGYSWLRDENPVTAPAMENNTVTGSVTVARLNPATGLHLSLTGLYNRYEQDTNIYRSAGATVSAGAQLLKKKALGLQGSAGYLFNRYSGGDASGNFTFGLNAGYNEGRHSLQGFANCVVTPPTSLNFINKVPQGVFTRNLAGGIAYSYRF
jgi:hypothetical protein